MDREMLRALVRAVVRRPWDELSWSALHDFCLDHGHDWPPAWIYPQEVAGSYRLFWHHGRRLRQVFLMRLRLLMLQYFGTDGRPVAPSEEIPF